MLNRLIKKLLPIAAMGLAVTGCDGMDISISGSEGVPLAELDTSGPAPTGIVIAGAEVLGTRWHGYRARDHALAEKGRCRWLGQG